MRCKLKYYVKLHKGSIKVIYTARMRVHPSCLSFFLSLAYWNRDEMPGAPTAILDYVANLKIKSTFKWWKIPWCLRNRHINPTVSNSKFILWERNKLSVLSHCYLGLSVLCRWTWPYWHTFLFLFFFFFFFLTPGWILCIGSSEYLFSEFVLPEIT